MHTHMEEARGIPGPYPTVTGLKPTKKKPEIEKHRTDSSVIGGLRDFNCATGRQRAYSDAMSLFFLTLFQLSFSPYLRSLALDWNFFVPQRPGQISMIIKLSTRATSCLYGVHVLAGMFKHEYLPMAAHNRTGLCRHTYVSEVVLPYIGDVPCW